MEIFFASSNLHKIKEINALLPSAIIVRGLKEAGIIEEIPETGATIKENSFIKANFLHNRLKENNPNVIVFADDSGLEVSALNNSPGVYSARYAGTPSNDTANNAKLIRELQNVTKRQARLVTIITLIYKSQVHYFEGEIKGSISYEPRGGTGFGYDPLFIPQGYRSTFAELGDEVKNQISHRAKAVEQLCDFISADKLI